MATHKEIRSFFYDEDMKEITDFLLKRYEPTKLSKLDILNLIYPVIKDNYLQMMSSKKIDFNILMKADNVIRRYLFPKSYIKGKEFGNLHKEFKNGNKKAFEMLLERNLHFPSLALSKLNYDSPFDEDLFEEGIILLMKYMKKYKDSDTYHFQVYLNRYLTCSLNSKIKEKYSDYEEVDINFLKPNTCIFYYEDDSNFDYDNVSIIFEKEELNFIKNFIIKAPGLSFLEKTSMMAKFGLIGRCSISYNELSKCFDCEKQNIQKAGSNGILKIKKIYHNCSSFEIENYDKYSNYGLCDYLLSDKNIVFNCMDNLTKEELTLIKYVWGNDFSAIKNLDNISFTKEQVILYYKAIAKIYKNIKIFISNSKKVISSDNKWIHAYQIYNEEKGQAFIKK